jgi:MFS family permease
MAAEQTESRAGRLEPSTKIGEFRRGGLVLFAAFLGVGVGVSSLLYYSLGVFIKPLGEEFGWSRAEVSGANILAVAALAVLSPLIGGIIDRVGIRPVALFSLLAFAIGLFALSAMNGSLIVYYGIIMAIGIFASGSSPVTFTRAVNGWFDRARGLALGMALVGTGVAAILAPRVLGPFVEAEGWRAGMQVLALVVVSAAPIVWLFLRDDPKGGGGKGAATPTAVARVDRAPLDRTFFILAIVFLAIALAVGGLIVHLFPLLTDAGMSATQAGTLGALVGVSVIAGRLVTGFLIDLVFAPLVAAILFGLAALGCLALLLGGPDFAALGAIAIGFSIGAEVDLIGYLVARYYGMRAYGRVYGRLYAVFLVGAGTSPMLTGLVFDLSGSYQLALIAATLLLAMSSALFLTLPRFPTNTAGEPAT